MPRIPFRFYLISDDQSYPGKLLQLVPELPKVPHVALQIREKSLSPLAQMQLIRQVNAHLSGAASCFCFLNDRADLAMSAGLYGVHLREDSCPPHQLHPLLKEYLAVGVSTHTIEGVLKAEQSGADFVTLGPIFQTASKEKQGAPLGLEVLAQAVQQTAIPIFALGGITLERVRGCMQAGAYGISVISAVWQSEQPLTTIQRFQQEILRALL